MYARMCVLKMGTGALVTYNTGFSELGVSYISICLLFTYTTTLKTVMYHLLVQINSYSFNLIYVLHSSIKPSYGSHIINKLLAVTLLLCHAVVGSTLGPFIIRLPSMSPHSWLRAKFGLSSKMRVFWFRNYLA